MRNRRGQAAMEFLMTYGWAILAAIIVVGVLWYIIGNPANLAGDKFVMSPPLSNNAMQLSTSGVVIEIRNGAGDSVNITSVNITNCATTSPNIAVGDGSLQQFTVNCTLQSGSRFKGDVTMTYTKSGSTLPQQATGTISGRVP